MRTARVWAGLLGVEKTVVEGVDFDEDAGVIVVSVRARRSARSRCGLCGRRSAGYDQGQGRRQWPWCCPSLVLPMTASS